MGQHVGTHRFSMSYPRFVVVEAQTGRPTSYLAMIASPRHDFQSSMQRFPL